jgi:hypothetical protein
MGQGARHRLKDIQIGGFPLLAVYSRDSAHFHGPLAIPNIRCRMGRLMGLSPEIIGFAGA